MSSSINVLLFRWRLYRSPPPPLNIPFVCLERKDGQREEERQPLRFADYDNKRRIVFYIFRFQIGRSTPVAQLAPRNLLTRWDVSSIPANGIFLTKN